MKTFYKVMACLGAALLLMGAVLSGVSLAKGGREYLRYGLDLADYWRLDRLQDFAQGADSSSTSADTLTPTPTPASTPTPTDSPSDSQAKYGVSEIDFELGAGEFVLVQGTDFSITTASGSMRGITAKMEDGCWKIQCAGSSLRGLGRVTITVPTDFVAEKANIEIGAGSLYITGLSANEFDLSVGAGRAELSDCTLADAKLECAMGELIYNGVLTGRGSVDCGMGNVEIYLKNQDSFGWSVDCGIGSVEVMGYRYSGLGAEATQDPGAAVYYEIDCGMGNVTIQRRG